jgi:3-methyladenine DNA glycosylase/8-oxoguanine DNA glycosylase
MIFNLTGHVQTERAGWMKEVNFSLSYEQLTRIAEERIRECNLDSQGAIYISESAKAGAVLSYWYELAINGYASVNAIKRQEP